MVSQGEIIGLVAIGLGALFLSNRAFASTDVRPIATQSTEFLAFQSNVDELNRKNAEINRLIAAEHERTRPPTRLELEAQLEGILLAFNQNPFGRGGVVLSRSGAVIRGGPVGFSGNISLLPSREKTKINIVSEFNKIFGTRFSLIRGPNIGALSVDVI